MVLLLWAALGSFPGWLPAVDYTWNLDTDGNWSTGVNWLPNTSYPDASTAKAFMLGAITTNRTITLTENIRLGLMTVSNANAYTFTGSFRIELDGGGATFSGVVSGTAGMTKLGPETLTLSGSSANTYSGVTTVNEGTLMLNKTAGVNAFAGTLTVGDGSGGANADIVRLSANNQIPTVAVTINRSGLLDLNGFSYGVGALTMTGGSVTTGAVTLTLGGDVTGNADASTATISGNLALGANRTFTIADGAAATDMSLSAVVSGAFTLTKAGAGTLQLSGANTYTGATTVSNGNLNIQNSAALGTTAAGTTVQSGGELQLQTGIAVSGEALTLNGSGVSSGGALRNISGNNSWSGGVTLGSASTLATDSGTLTLSGNLTNGGFTSTFSGSGDITANSIIDFGSGASVVHFGNSSGVSWTAGTTLIITNWTGGYAGGGTDQLFFGSGITGLTGSQLGKIEFTDNLGHRQLANILANGEVVPVPEPATWAGLALLVLGVGLHERRRLVCWFSGLRWRRGAKAAPVPL